MKTIILTEKQLEVLNYILHRAHHIPLPNSTAPDTILPVSRELVEIVNNAAKQDDNLTPRPDAREFFAR